MSAPTATPSVAEQLQAYVDDLDKPEAPAQPAAPTEEPEAPAEPEDAPEEAEEEPAEPVPTVKVGDEDVPLEELTKGYLRNKDYTQKTMTLAEERRAVEARSKELDEAKRVRDAYAERLGALSETLKALTPAEEDLSALKASDPSAYAARVAERIETQQKTERIQREAMRVEQERLAERLTVERGKLLDAVPEWKNADTFAKDNASLLAFGRARGFSDHELASVTDHRALLLLRDAYRYTQLKTDKPGKPAAPKAPVLKPGAVTPAKRAPDAAVQAMAKLKKTGRLDDARDAIFQLLERESA